MSLPCVLERSHPAPLGMYLKRSWLQPGEVLFMYTKTELTTAKGGDKNRTSASGDPSDHAVNITLSQLTVGDTDRYHCEFVVANEASADLQLPGRTDFFLLVTAGGFVFPVWCLLSETPSKWKHFKTTVAEQSHQNVICAHA